ncbi:MAG: NAD(P)H-flavin reductase [Idiomarina sp.]|nr:NAD(P)H-flavin reductase [Idiomarina sp.]
MSKQSLTCKVNLVEPLHPAIFRVELEPEAPVSYVPGQYIAVVMAENDIRPFSIASTPAHGNRIELHIGATPDNPYAWDVLERLRVQDTIEVTAPQGTAGYRSDNQRPLLLVAGGTGFSYAWAILSAHLASADPRPLTLYWGGKQLPDLYFHERLQALTKDDARFSYRPVLEQPPAAWTGAKGFVHRAVLEEHPDLSAFDVYVAGRFEMVRVLRDDFLQHNLPVSQLHGDALGYL